MHCKAADWVDTYVLWSTFDREDIGVFSHGAVRLHVSSLRNEVRYG
jgi:hypothetical protein